MSKQTKKMIAVAAVVLAFNATANASDVDLELERELAAIEQSQSETSAATAPSGQDIGKEAKPEILTEAAVLTNSAASNAAQEVAPENVDLRQVFLTGNVVAKGSAPGVAPSPSSAPPAVAKNAEQEAFLAGMEEEVVELHRPEPSQQPQHSGVPAQEPVAQKKPSSSDLKNSRQADQVAAASPQQHGGSINTAPTHAPAKAVHAEQGAVAANVSRNGMPALPSNLEADLDTFGHALRRQAELARTELEAKIASNSKRADTQEAAAPNPLVNAFQTNHHAVPVLVALWGLEGNEIAEITYKGKTVPVSRANKVINATDGWQLEEFTTNSVVVVKRLGNKVRERKVISISNNAQMPGFN